MVDDPRNERNLYRLPYPRLDRPLLRLGEEAYEVTELSERGLRFRHEDKQEFRTGEPVIGAITFHDKQVVDIKGVIGRIDAMEVVVLQLHGITFSRVMAEQRHLVRKYPFLYLH